MRYQCFLSPASSSFECWIFSGWSSARHSPQKIPNTCTPARKTERRKRLLDRKKRWKPSRSKLVTISKNSISILTKQSRWERSRSGHNLLTHDDGAAGRDFPFYVLFSFFNPPLPCRYSFEPCLKKIIRLSREGRFFSWKNLRFSPRGCVEQQQMWHSLLLRNHLFVLSLAEEPFVSLHSVNNSLELLPFPPLLTIKCFT